MTSHAASALAVALAAVLAAVPAAAQEGGATVSKRHENRITDAAKEAFARMEKAMYRPVAAGLESLAATVTMKLDVPPEARGQMPEMNLEYTVDFRAPTALKVQAKPSDDPVAGMVAPRMTTAVSSLLRMSLGLNRPSDDEEFDADAATADGKTVVTVVRFSGEKETGRDVLTLDDRNLPVTVTTSSAGGRAGRSAGSNTSKCAWKKQGEQYLLEKVTTSEGGSESTATLTYADLGGFRIATAWTLSAEAGAGQSMSFGIRFSDVTINGKKAEPGAATATPKKE